MKLKSNPVPNTAVGRRLRRGFARRAPIARVTAFLCITLLSSCGISTKKAAEGVRFFVSDGKSDFSEAPVKGVSKSLADFTVSDTASGAPIEGFGGSFNENGWEALGKLPPAERDLALDAIFKPGLGLSLNLCRIPIGSSDYALSRYSLDDKENDYTMAGFSIERDKKALIPYIKAAQARNPALRFWASAWSPPPWMKDNRDYDSGNMRDDRRVYAAYALYFVKFAAAYKGEGIPVEQIAVQNEPQILRNYPTCGWQPAQFLTFVRDYMGPALEGTGTGVMLGTFNEASNQPYAMAVLSDPDAKGFAKSLGLQWGGGAIIDAVRLETPDIPVWHTETDCGNHNWEAGFDPEKPQNDFTYAAYTWDKMRDYLGAGTLLYSLWNIVLDPEGKSIDSKVPWPQNAAVVADASSGKAIYTPMYYAFASFSRFLPPGSRLLKSSSSASAIAFSLPDGGKAVVLMNKSAAERSFAISLDGRTIQAKLPPRSFGTVLKEKRE